MKKFDGYSRVLPWFMALLLSVLVAACGGGGQAPILGTGDVVSQSAKAITSYSLAGVTGVVNETAKTIVLTLPNGSNVTALVATFSSTGAGVMVGATPQISEVTPNNFSAPVVYTVTAPDGSSASYTVAVTVASSSAKALSAYSLAGVAGTINEAGKSIAVVLPFGTSLVSQVATFTSSGASVKVGATTQVSGSTANNFSAPVTYTVTAADSSTVTYSVNVSVAANTAKALSAYSLAGVPGVINESAKTISLTLPFGSSLVSQVASFTSSGASVKVGAVTQTSGSTANNFSAPVTYTVTAADSSTVTYSVSASVAPDTAKAITGFSLGGVPGVINESAKTVSLTLPFGSNLSALVASFTSTGAGVKVGTATQISGSTANDFSVPLSYTVTAADNSSTSYTVAVAVASNTAKALSSYSLAGVAGTINEAGKSIAVVLPFGTSLVSQVATFTSSGASVKVGATTQVSGSTANNFSAPVTYTVTAADNSTVSYSVSASVAANTAKALTAYSLAGVPGVISESAKTIAVTLPAGSSVTALTAAFSSTGAGVKVGTTTQISGVTANNFSSPVSYTVTAADNSTVNYAVTVLVAPSSAKAITAYALGGVNGTINQSAKTIAVALPSGTSLTALVASFTSTGTGVKVGATTQISGATANNFSAPVSYTVTAADASTVTYSVSASVATAGPAPVSLGAAGNFVILAKSAISTVPASAITGDIGVSPAATTFLTGFSLTLVGTTSATSTQVTGDLFGADMTTPTNSNLTTSVSAMEAAYTDAASRPAPPDFLNLGSGEIGGQTLAPGLYTWTSGVSISSNVTVSGGPNDVWIFQIPGNLTMSAARNVILAGGAKAKNIFWQVAGFVEIGTNAHFEGILLSQTAIHLRTGASMNGRALAQTEVTLDQATVTQPAP